MAGITTSRVLEIEDLRVTFRGPSGPLPAVDGIELAVHAGETVALVGESGCGKTMTALAVLGLVPDEIDRSVSGSIRFDGRPIESLPRRQLRRVRGLGISMVFQQPVSSLNPVFRIGDQIADVLRAHDRRLSRGLARDRAVDLLDSVGIPNAGRRINEYPHQWSGGMCQRAVIAMAIANQPRLVIADEPTTALDVTVQARVLQVLREAQDMTGAGLLLITHDLGVVAEMADRVAVMYAGRIVETADVDTVFHAARHPYTRGLLASLPRLDGTGDLVSIPGQPPQLHAIPGGCAFHTRCSIAAGRDRCATEVPSLRPVGSTGHAAACHYHEDLVGAVGPEAAGVDRASTRGATGTEPVLTVREVAVHFPVRSRVLGRTVGHVRAVDGISFDLLAGETLGLVGESGCGKSTTANAIMRLYDVSAGTIVFDGRNLAEVSRRQLRQVRRGIQMVFQDPYASVDPKMTVADTIAEPLWIHGISRREGRQRVTDLLEMVGLDRSHGDRFPHQFSGGQLQRVGIARALALEPQVLVLDEPVSALDVSIQAQILNLLADLQARLGPAYLMIAHDLSVVRHAADRVAVMYLGRIVELGTTKQVYDAPRHPYTQALLDAVPIPDPRQRGTDRIILPGEVPHPAAPPAGCHFHPRCWKAEPRCATEAPVLTDRGGDAQPVACHFPDTPQLLPLGGDDASRS